MKIFNLHILTGKSLKKLISRAKDEQRSLDSSMMAKLVDDNIRLKTAYVNLKGGKKRKK